MAATMTRLIRISLIRFYTVIFGLSDKFLWVCLWYTYYSLLFYLQFRIFVTLRPVWSATTQTYHSYSITSFIWDTCIYAISHSMIVKTYKCIIIASTVSERPSATTSVQTLARSFKTVYLILFMSSYLILSHFIVLSSLLISSYLIISSLHTD